MAGIKKLEHYSDTEAIARILAGETQLYELLVRRHNPYLYRLGRAYGYNHHDTEDLMQETYISAYYGLDKFQGKSSVRTWMTRIMLNNCYHKKQKSSFKHEKPVEAQPEKNTPMFQNQQNTDKRVLTKELGHVLENALQEIPEDYRIVFTLRELNELSVAETAEVAGISEDNVKARLSRAKSMLRSNIEKMYSTTEIYEFNLVHCDKIVERVLNQIEKERK